MGGLIARYYLRYGTAEPDPDAPVTWAGARRIRNLILVAVPNGGGVHALEALLLGNRVGLSYATLASPVVTRMPSVYQLLPPIGAPALVDHTGEPIDADLHDVETWRRFGWGPFGAASRRLVALADGRDKVEHPAFLEAALLRARAFHAALARTPETPCPAKVILLGGDCLPTLARALVPERPGMPRFEPLNRKEAEGMFDAGDGRVTRASVLGAHLPGADDTETGSGYPEVAQSFFGSADHHGIYNEPTFQSVLLRRLLRPAGTAKVESPRGQGARMTAAGRFFASSIGKKVVMAVTGFALFGFVVGPHAGQPAGVPGPRRAQRLRRGAARTSARCCGRRASACWWRSALHIWAAYSLTMMNRAARPQGYREKEHRESTYASRTMRWSGVLLLLFIVYHLMHLTWGNAHPDFVARRRLPQLHRGLPADPGVRSSTSWPCSPSGCTCTTASGASCRRSA